jgi:tRNA-dihydrouridine synthase A
MIDRKLAVAPMMDWTDRHCRYFLRLFSPRVLLYTEMITAAAILRGDRERLLRYSTPEHPLAVQLGGSDPGQLAIAARAAQEAGYLEVNLNCGCPSERVVAGAFGACLMLEPTRVADCIAAMRAAVSIPVTVKLRIGVVDRDLSGAAANDAAMLRYDEDDYAALLEFATGCVSAGAAALIVHARKAALGGLSPHENRTIPPLRFDVVSRLRAQLRGTPIVINGGIATQAAAVAALRHSDGVMIGREAYHRPWLLSEMHQALYAPDGWTVPDFEQIFEAMAMYAAAEMARGTPLHSITRHMLGLVSGRPGAREYRQLLSHEARQAPDARSLFHRALAVIRRPVEAFASPA